MFNINYNFFNPKPLDSPLNWIFSRYHFYLVLGVLVFLILLYFLSSKKHPKITKVSLAVTLFILEIGRISQEIYLHYQNYGNLVGFDWYWRISFQMCALMTWFTIFTLIISLFLKENSRFKTMAYYILLGNALVGGFLTFVIPDNISGELPIFCFENLQTIVTHTLLVFVPIYLIKIKEFIPRINNFVHVVVGYAYIGSIAMTASLVSGDNFAFAFGIYQLDLKIMFPLEYPIIFLLMCVLGFIVILIAELLTKKEEANDLFVDRKLALLSISIYSILIMLGLAYLIGKEKPTYQGLLVLISFVYLVVGIIYVLRKDPKKEVSKLELISLMILNQPLGLLALRKMK